MGLLSGNIAKVEGATLKVDGRGNPYYEIDTITVTGTPMRQYLLGLSGEFYYHNISYWRDAMRYMRDIGDTDAEYVIFMKRVDYDKQQWGKAIFTMMGVIVGSVLTVEAFAVGYAGVSAAVSRKGVSALVKAKDVSKSIFMYNKASTYIRMGTNGLVQAGFREDGFRGINISSIFSEMVAPGIGALTSVIEIRPFTKYDDPIRMLGYNKSLSETLFDMSTHYAGGRFTNSVKGVLRNGADPKTLNQLRYIALPVYGTGYEIIKQTFEVILKDIFGIGDKPKEDKR